MFFRKIWSKLNARDRVQLMLALSLAPMIVLLACGGWLRDILVARFADDRLSANAVFFLNVVPILPFLLLGGCIFWYLIKATLAHIEASQERCPNCHKEIRLDSHVVVASRRCPHCRDVLLPDLEPCNSGEYDFVEFQTLLGRGDRRPIIDTLIGFVVLIACETGGMLLLFSRSTPTGPPDPSLGNIVGGIGLLIAGILGFMVVFTPCAMGAGGIAGCPHCQRPFSFAQAPYLCSARNCPFCGLGVLVRPPVDGAGAIRRQKYVAATAEFRRRSLRAYLGVVIAMAITGMILRGSEMVVGVATNWRPTSHSVSNDSPLFYLVFAVMMAPIGHFFWRYWCNVKSGDWPFHCPHCRANMRPHSLVAATLNCPRCGKQALIDDS